MVVERPPGSSRRTPGSNNSRFIDLHVFSRPWREAQLNNSARDRAGDLPILGISCYCAKSLHNTHSRTNTTEDSVLVVQVWCGGKGDEEL